VAAHIRIVRVLWIATGLAFAAWGIWGLATEGHDVSVVEGQLILLVFAALAVAGGFFFGRTRVLGRLLICVASVISLLYALAWLFLGGVDDALVYVFGIIPLVCLSIYALVIANVGSSAA